MTTKTYNKGEVIFRQGDYSENMYRILNGSVGVFLDYGQPTEKKLSVLKAGQYLGEMGMIEVYPRSATAVVEEDGTELREIGDGEFREFFNEEPAQLLVIMRQMSQRLRDRTDDYTAALQILKELDDTRDDPGKRSKTLKDKVNEILDFYNKLLLAYPYSISDYDINLMQHEYYYPTNFYFF